MISVAVPPGSQTQTAWRIMKTSDVFRLVNAARQGRIYRSKRPEFGTTSRAKVRVGVFAQLDYFPFAHDCPLARTNTPASVGPSPSWYGPNCCARPDGPEDPPYIRGRPRLRQKLNFHDVPEQFGHIKCAAVFIERHGGRKRETVCKDGSRGRRRG